MDFSKRIFLLLTCLSWISLAGGDWREHNAFQENETQATTFEFNLPNLPEENDEQVASGYRKSDIDDDKKPKPGFWGETPWLVPEQKNWLTELMAAIIALGNQYQSEREYLNQQERLRELAANIEASVEENRRNEAMRAITPNSESDQMLQLRKEAYQSHYFDGRAFEPKAQAHQGNVPGILEMSGRGRGRTSLPPSGAGATERSVGKNGMRSGQGENNESSHSKDGEDGNDDPNEPLPASTMSATPCLNVIHVEEKVESNGLESTFKTTLDDTNSRLQCSVTGHVVKISRNHLWRCEDNGTGHAICNDCFSRLQAATSLSSQCPQCRSNKWFLINGSELDGFKEQLDNLIWTCSYCSEPVGNAELEEHNLSCIGNQNIECEREGCHYQQLEKLWAEDDHSEHCQYTEVGCSHYGCNDRLLRKDLEDHLKECRFRQIPVVMMISPALIDAFGQLSTSSGSEETMEPILNSHLKEVCRSGENIFSTDDGITCRTCVNHFQNNKDFKLHQKECHRVIFCPVCNQETLAGAYVNHRACRDLSRQCDVCMDVIQPSDAITHRLVCRKQVSLDTPEGTLYFYFSKALDTGMGCLYKGVDETMSCWLLKSAFTAYDEAFVLRHWAFGEERVITLKHLRGRDHIQITVKEPGSRAFSIRQFLVKAGPEVTQWQGGSEYDPVRDKYTTWELDVPLMKIKSARLLIVVLVLDFPKPVNHDDHL